MTWWPAGLNTEVELTEICSKLKFWLKSEFTLLVAHYIAHCSNKIIYLNDKSKFDYSLIYFVMYFRCLMAGIKRRAPFMNRCMSSQDNLSSMFLKNHFPTRFSWKLNTLPILCIFFDGFLVWVCFFWGGGGWGEVWSAFCFFDVFSYWSWVDQLASK